MERSVLARIAAIIFVAIAITTAVVEMSRDEEGQAVRPVPLVTPAVDPLRAEQRRCQLENALCQVHPDYRILHLAVLSALWLSDHYPGTLRCRLGRAATTPSVYL